jgi:hypothetical protein
MPDADDKHGECIICHDEISAGSDEKVSPAQLAAARCLSCFGELCARGLCVGSQQCGWTRKVRVFTCRRVATAKDKACMPIFVCGGCHGRWVSARWPGEFAVDAIRFVLPRQYPECCACREGVHRALPPGR